METEILPIKVKLEMLCCQFLASACCPSHPLNPIVWSPPRLHPMKQTLSSKFGALGVPYLDAHRQLPSQVFTRTFIQLHSYFVRVGICSLGPNRVLGHRLPRHSNSDNLPSSKVFNTQISGFIFPFHRGSKLRKKISICFFTHFEPLAYLPE